MTITDVATLLAHAHAMEQEAAERYEELAAQMYAVNNSKIGDLFTKLAEIEAKHAAQLSLEHGAANLALTASDYKWNSLESPEAIPIGEMHYLLPERRAMTLALAAEHRALAFYERLADDAPNEKLRAMAAEFAADEATHVRIVQAWLLRLEADVENWHEDMDPPVSL